METPERLKYIMNWQRTNPKFKIIQHRYAISKKGKMKNREWVKNNLDKVRKKDKKYSISIKGIVNSLKKKDKKKFNIVNKDITIELIDRVNKRDKNCVYCDINLENNLKEYDHINPFKPFSANNIVGCCRACNRSKNNANVYDWCNFKGYKVKPMITQYLNTLKCI